MYKQERVHMQGEDMQDEESANSRDIPDKNGMPNISTKV